MPCALRAHLRRRARRPSGRVVIRLAEHDPGAGCTAVARHGATADQAATDRVARSRQVPRRLCRGGGSTSALAAASNVQSTLGGTHDAGAHACASQPSRHPTGFFQSPAAPPPPPPQAKPDATIAAAAAPAASTSIASPHSCALDLPFGSAWRSRQAGSSWLTAPERAAMRQGGTERLWRAATGIGAVVRQAGKVQDWRKPWKASRTTGTGRIVAAASCAQRGGNASLSLSRPSDAAALAGTATTNNPPDGA